MKKPAASFKTQAGIPGRVAAIVEHLARAVVYLASALALVAVVSSCAATWEPFDCNTQPEQCL